MQPVSHLKNNLVVLMVFVSVAMWNEAIIASPTASTPGKDALSGAKQATTPSSQDNPPQLTSPKNHANNLSRLSLTLSWITKPKSEYTLQISTSSDFLSTIYVQTDSTSSWKADCRIIRPQNTYYWRVGVDTTPRAVWSLPYSFTTKEDSINLVAPCDAGGAVLNQDSSLNLIWETLPGISAYTLIISTSSNFSSTINGNQVIDTTIDSSKNIKKPIKKISKIINNLEPNTRYYWQIIGIPDEGCHDTDDTIHSKSWNFTTHSASDSDNCFSIGIGGTFDVGTTVDVNNLYSEVEYENLNLIQGKHWFIPDGIDVCLQSGKLFSIDSINTKTVIQDSTFNDSMTAKEYNQSTKITSNIFSVSASLNKRMWGSWGSHVHGLLYWECREDVIESEPSLQFINNVPGYPSDSLYLHQESKLSQMTVWDWYLGLGFLIENENKSGKFSLKAIATWNTDLNTGFGESSGVIYILKCYYLIKPIGAKIGCDVRGGLNFGQAQMMFYFTKNITAGEIENILK
jgi:hypothetical protein